MRKLYPLPPPASQQTFEELAEAVGINASQGWAVVQSIEQIDAKSTLTPLVVVIDGWAVALKLTVRTSSLALGDGCMFRLVGRPMPRSPEPGEWPSWSVEHLPPPWPTELGFVVQTWLMQAWRPQGVIVAQVAWSPDEPAGDRSIRTLDNSWRDTDLTNAGKALRFLEGLTAPKEMGRGKLRDDPAWRATMREIDAYRRRNRNSKLEIVVDRFSDYLVKWETLDDDRDIEEEDGGEKRRKAAALDKLKRWLREWKKVPESVKKA